MEQINAEQLEVLTLPRYARHVHMTLSDLHRLRERRYSRADYGACDTLIDLERAINNADLTERQYEVLYLMYEKGWTQVEVASEFDIAQQAVSVHKNAAIKKIADSMTGRRGGGD